jgi:hypothetical protein
MRKTIAFQETFHEAFELPENPTISETASRARKKSPSALGHIPRENGENSVTRNVLNNLVMHFGNGA